MVREWLPNGAATEPGTVSGFDGTVALQRVAVALALAEDDMPTARAWLDAYDRWLAWSGAVRGRSEGHALWARYDRATGDLPLARGRR